MIIIDYTHIVTKIIKMKYDRHISIHQKMVLSRMKKLSTNKFELIRKAIITKNIFH